MEDNSIILNELGIIKQNIIAIREELADRILTRDNLIAIEDYKKEKVSKNSYLNLFFCHLFFAFSLCSNIKNILRAKIVDINNPNQIPIIFPVMNELIII